MSDFQIVHTLEEARAQGQGAIFVNPEGDPCTLKGLTISVEILRSPRYIFPVAVLATGEQVQAASKAIEQKGKNRHDPTA